MRKLLLDENLPKKLKYRFGEGFDVTTVPERGWNSLKNGELLKAMNQAGIEYLITADKNLSYQQNYQKSGVKLIVLNTFDSQYEFVLPFVAKIKLLFEESTIQDYNWIDPWPIPSFIQRFIIFHFTATARSSAARFTSTSVRAREC